MLLFHYLPNQRNAAPNFKIELEAHAQPATEVTWRHVRCSNLKGARRAWPNLDKSIVRSRELSLVDTAEIRFGHLDF